MEYFDTIKTNAGKAQSLPSFRLYFPDDTGFTPACCFGNPDKRRFHPIET